MRQLRISLDNIQVRIWTKRSKYLYRNGGIIMSTKQLRHAKNANFKNTYAYLAIFEFAEDGISVEFPDLPGVFTCGDTEEEAFRNASEALGLHLFGMEEDGDEIPHPRKIVDLDLDYTHQAAVLVTVNMPLVRARVQRASVKKTLTIPKYLNDLGELNGINFSVVLQEALKEKLDIQDTV